jgi:hypothetical protein
MLAPMLLIWPLGAALTFWIAQGLATQPYDAALAEAARRLAGQLAQGRSAADLTAEARSWLQAEDSEVISFQVLGRRGELLAGESRLSVPSDGQRNPGEARFRDEELGGEELRVVALWVRAQPEDRELMLVQIGESLGQRKHLANAIVRGVTLPLLSLLPLAAVLAWLALVRGFKPVEALQQRIRFRAPRTSARSTRTRCSRSWCRWCRPSTACSNATGNSIKCSASSWPTPRTNSRRRWPGCARRPSWRRVRCEPASSTRKSSSARSRRSR